MSSKVSSRLNRILLMVPYIVGPDGASIRELCGKFRVSREELMCDLDTLRMCGVPNYTPYDLIDYWVEGDRVHVEFADFFERPLTLTREEAVALFVAGHALIRSRMFRKDSALGSALDKVGQVLSRQEKEDVESVIERILVEMDAYSGRWKEIIEEGLEKKKNLLIEYYSFSRGEMTTREVEPLSLVWSSGYWYLLAWCHEADRYPAFQDGQDKEREPHEKESRRGGKAGLRGAGAGGRVQAWQESPPGQAEVRRQGGAPPGRGMAHRHGHRGPRRVGHGGVPDPEPLLAVELSPEVR